MTSTQESAVIEALRSAEISEVVSYIPTPFGSKALAIDLGDLDTFLADPVAYKAGLIGVAREKFLAWQRYIREECRCRGTTRAGRRCRNPGHVCDAHEFAEGISDYCNVHCGYR